MRIENLLFHIIAKLDRMEKKIMLLIGKDTPCQPPQK